MLDKLEEAEELRQQEEGERANVESRPEKLRRFFEKADEQEADQKGGAKGSVEPIAHQPQWQPWQQWSWWGPHPWQQWWDRQQALDRVVWGWSQR